MYSTRKKGSLKSSSIVSNVTYQIKQINIISYLEEGDCDEFRALRQDHVCATLEVVCYFAMNLP